MRPLGMIPYIYHSERPKPSGTSRIAISRQFMYPKVTSDNSPWD